MTPHSAIGPWLTQLSNVVTEVIHKKRDNQGKQGTGEFHNSILNILNLTVVHGIYNNHHIYQKPTSLPNFNCGPNHFVTYVRASLASTSLSLVAVTVPAGVATGAAVLDPAVMPMEPDGDAVVSAACSCAEAA
eukprot:15358552-Ditylum_brightwellii.AAC.1